MAQRVLVIDDDPENQFLIRVILQREGYLVDVKDNGLDGLSALAQERFDLIVLDVMMPDVNGFEVYRRLQADDRTRGMPVIMLTAMAQRKDYEQAAQLGVKHYMTKPFEPDDLIARVQDALAPCKEIDDAPNSGCGR